MYVSIICVYRRRQHVNDHMCTAIKPNRKVYSAMKIFYFDLVKVLFTVPSSLCTFYTQFGVVSAF